VAFELLVELFALSVAQPHRYTTRSSFTAVP
jgi:hypothetical protein